jgi:outer membrane protein OmpA-like peptidoglycan-associated protein
MKVRTSLMVAAILAVLAYLILGPAKRQFGDDARTIARRAEPQSAPQITESKQEVREAQAYLPESQPVTAARRESAAFDDTAQPAAANLQNIERYKLTFDAESTNLAYADREKLSEFARLYRRGRTRQITILISEGAQSPLMRERAAAVRRHLVNYGVAERVISAVSNTSGEENVIIVVAEIQVPELSDAVAAAPPP